MSSFNVKKLRVCALKLDLSEFILKKKSILLRLAFRWSTYIKNKILTVTSNCSNFDREKNCMYDVNRKIPIQKSNINCSCQLYFTQFQRVIAIKSKYNLDSTK